jgi:hypothetical protein
MEDKIVAILQMVQDGKISAQDAATLIQAVRDAEARPASSADAPSTPHRTVGEKIYADVRPFVPMMALIFCLRLLIGR